MNPNNIGTYIAKKRKNKNLTQQELADKINVSVKAISKWECGKGLPEITNLKMLANELKVSITDILNGEDSKNQDVVVEYIKKKDKKNKTKILFLTFLIVVLLLLLLFGLYFVNNYNKIYAYRLSGENNNFQYDNGLIIVSNYSNIISSGNLKFKDDKFKQSISILNIELKNDEKRIISGNNLHNETYLVSEQSGYNELIDNNNNNINKWSIEITYLLNNNIVKEVIELKSELMFKNNKLITKSVESISDNTSITVDGLDYSYALKLKEYLLNEKGFKEHSDDFGYITKIHNDNNGNIISSINVFPFSGLVRGFFNFDDAQISFNHSYFNIDTKQKLNNNVISLSGEYLTLDKGQNIKSDNNEKYFSFIYNFEKDESACTYGKCPDNYWEIGKTIYNDLSCIWEY